MDYIYLSNVGLQLQVGATVFRIGLLHIQFAGPSCTSWPWCVWLVSRLSEYQLADCYCHPVNLSCQLCMSPGSVPGPSCVCKVGQTAQTEGRRMQSPAPSPFETCHSCIFPFLLMLVSDDTQGSCMTLFLLPCVLH